MWPIVGHKRNIKILDNQIKTNTVSQSYLFLGPSALGKFTLAKVFAKNLLCENNNSCDQCSSCQQFSRDLHPDFMLIKNTKSLIPIATVRELKRQISLLPSLSKRKVIILEEASYLTLEAQNALLKTLEEPPKYATIILVAQKDNLLPTILSRCTQLNFQPVPLNEIKNKLSELGVNKDKALILAYLSNGQIGRILADLSFLEKWEKSFQNLANLLSFNMKEKLDYAKDQDPDEILFWTSIFRSVLYFKLNPSLLPNYPPFLDKLSKLSGQFDLKKAHSLLKKLQETQELLNTSVNRRLLLENLVLAL